MLYSSIPYALRSQGQPAPAVPLHATPLPPAQRMAAEDGLLQQQQTIAQQQQIITQQQQQLMAIQHAPTPVE